MAINSHIKCYSECACTTVIIKILNICAVKSQIHENICIFRKSSSGFIILLFSILIISSNLHWFFIVSSFGTSIYTNLTITTLMYKMHFFSSYRKSYCNYYFRSWWVKTFCLRKLWLINCYTLLKTKCFQIWTNPSIIDCLWVKNR